MIWPKEAESVLQGKEAVRIVLQYNHCIACWKGHEAD